MKVLALDFSPTPQAHSMTSLHLNALVAGMSKAGATVETVKIDKQKYKVNPCDGCFHCWTITPGECKTINDYMSRGLFAKWKAADMVVYATPIYNQFMTAAMKSFIERLQPAGNLANFRGDNSLKNDNKIRFPDTVVLATATYYGKEEFSFFSQYMHQYYAREKNTQIIAELYRPQVKFVGIKHFPKFRNRVLSAFEKAGEELILKKNISKDTMKNATCDLTDDKRFQKLLLLANKSILKHNMSHKSFMKKNPPLHITDIDDFILLCEILFQNVLIPQNVLKDFSIQFLFDEGMCYIDIDSSNINIYEGHVSNHNITIKTDLSTWMGIMNGTTNFSDALNTHNIQWHFHNKNEQKYFLTLMSSLIQHSQQ